MKGQFAKKRWKILEKLVDDKKVYFLKLPKIFFSDFRFSFPEQRCMCLKKNAKNSYNI